MDAQTDRITGMIELVNYVLMAAGATKKWVPPDVDLDALEPEELDELLSDMVEDMTTREKSKVYPLVQTKHVARGSTYRDQYIVFWELLADQLLNSDEEFMATRENANMLR